MSFNILRTESKSELAKVTANIEKDLDPTDSIERLFVEDIAYHTWEMMRYRRVATGIFDNALRRALALIVNEILLPPSPAMTAESWMSSQRLSYEWLFDPLIKRRVAALLKEAGHDESAIEAKAYILVADDLENANRMLKSAGDGRDRALRSISKYRKKWAIQLRRSSDRVLAADQVPLIASGEEN